MACLSRQHFVIMFTDHPVPFGMGRRCLSTSSETPTGLNFGKSDRNKKAAVTKNNSQRLPFGSLGKQAPGLSKSDTLLGRENVKFSCLFRALTPVSSWSTHCRALHAGGQRLESSTAGNTGMNQAQKPPFLAASFLAQIQSEPLSFRSFGFKQMSIGGLSLESAVKV